MRIGISSVGNVLVVPPFECAWLTGNQHTLRNGSGCIVFEAKGETDVTVILKSTPGAKRWQPRALASRQADAAAPPGAAAAPAGDAAAGLDGAVNNDAAHPAAGLEATNQSPTGAFVEENYTIILGSHRNTCLKFEKNGQTHCSAHDTPGAHVSSREFQRFWVDYNRGTITVGGGAEPGQGVYFRWQDPNGVIPNIQHVGLSCWDCHVSYRNIQVIPAVTAWRPSSSGLAGTNGSAAGVDVSVVPTLFELADRAAAEGCNTTDACLTVRLAEMLLPTTRNLYRRGLEHLAAHLNAVAADHLDELLLLSPAVMMDLLQHPALVADEHVVYSAAAAWAAAAMAGGSHVDATADAVCSTSGVKCAATAGHNVSQGPMADSRQDAASTASADSSLIASLTETSSSTPLHDSRGPSCGGAGGGRCYPDTDADMKIEHHSDPVSHPWHHPWLPPSSVRLMLDASSAHSDCSSADTHMHDAEEVSAGQQAAQYNCSNPGEVCGRDANADACGTPHKVACLLEPQAVAAAAATTAAHHVSSVGSQGADISADIATPSVQHSQPRRAVPVASPYESAPVSNSAAPSGSPLRHQLATHLPPSPLPTGLGSRRASFAHLLAAPAPSETVHSTDPSWCPVQQYGHEEEVSRVLQLVRYPLMAPQRLQALLAEEPLLRQLPAVRALVHEALGLLQDHTTTPPASATSGGINADSDHHQLHLAGSDHERTLKQPVGGSTSTSGRERSLFSVEHGRLVKPADAEGALSFVRYQSRCLPLGRELSYVCDGDKNGLFHYLGTAGGTQQWLNPAAAKLVDVRASSPNCRTTDPKALLGGQFPRTNFAGPPRTAAGTSPSGQASAIGAWWAVDLKEHELIPTYYSMRHDGSQDYARCWALQASRDGQAWVDLRRHDHDTSLQVPGQWASYPIGGAVGGATGGAPSMALHMHGGGAFRHFRLMLTGPTASPTQPHNFSLSAFELYGYLFKAGSLATAGSMDKTPTTSAP